MCYDSNDISPIGWVKTECKTMVSFKYKSTPNNQLLHNESGRP